MKTTILTIVLLISSISFISAQTAIKSKEDIIQRIQDKLAAQGIEFTITDNNDSTNNPKKVHPFIAKWTGEEIPNFRLTDLSGNVVDMNDLKEKFVHINFWSTTCKPCIEEFSELNQLKEKYDDKKVVYLAIAPESKEKVKKVIKKHPINYIVIAEAKPLFDQLGIDGYPKNFFIDKNGIIQVVTDGTNYKMEMINEKMELTPDNFSNYNKIMKKLTEINTQK